MKIWEVRGQEAAIVSPFVDALCYAVNHWTHPQFMQKIEAATAEAEKLNRIPILRQSLFRVGENRVSEAISSPAFIEWNLRIRVTSFGLKFYSALDCEPYGVNLVRALNFPVAERVRKMFKEPIFDFATPGLYSPDAAPKVGPDSMYTVYPKAGRRRVTQKTYRSFPAIPYTQTAEPDEVVGVAVSFPTPPNHEYTPAEALDPARWFNRDNRDIQYFPVGDYIATAKEFARLMRDKA